MCTETRRQVSVAKKLHWILVSCCVICCSAGHSQVNSQPFQAIQIPVEPIKASPRLREIHNWTKGDRVSIQDAVSLALSLNRSVASAENSLKKAAGKTAETIASRNPTIGLAPSYVYEETSFQPEIIAGATLPLDISGLLKAATNQAKFQEIAFRLDIDRIRNQTVADVKSVYFEVLRAKALDDVAKENVKNSKTRLLDAEKKLEARAVTRYDVLRAQTDLAYSIQQQIRSEASVYRAMGSLNNVIGIDILSPIQVEQPQTTIVLTDTPAQGATNITEGSKHQAFPANDPELAKNVKSALQFRPEVFEADAAIAAAKQGIQIAKRSELPSFGVGVGYFNQRNSTGNVRIHDPRAFLSFNLPISDGGIARARTVQARAEVVALEISRRGVIDSITLDVQQSYLNYVQALEQVKVAQTALVQAKQGFELARVRYVAGVSVKAGISPLLELSDSQAALVLAQTNQVNSIFDLETSKSQLERATGSYAISTTRSK